MRKGTPQPAIASGSSPSEKRERRARARNTLRLHASHSFDNNNSNRSSNEIISATDLHNLIHVSSASIGCLAFEHPIDCSLSAEAFTHEIYATHSRCLEGNLQFAGFIGSSSPEHLIGKSLSTILPRRRGFSEMFTAWHRHRLSGQGFEFEAVDRGDRSIVLQAAIYGHIENEKLYRMWIILRDVTTVTRAISALSKSQKHYRALFNTPGILFFRILPDGTIEHATTATQSWLAISNAHMLTIDAVLESRLHPLDRAHFESMQSHRTSGLTHIFEAPLRLAREDGTYCTFLARQIAHVNFSGELDYYDILAFEKPVTESPSIHVAGTLHDLNNHLVVAKANVEMTMTQLPQGTPARAALESALTAINESTKLSSQALSTAVNLRPRPERIDVRSFLSDISTLVQPTCSSRASVRIGDIPADAALYADPIDLKRALINLIFNAQEAFHSTGTITLSATTIDDVTPKVSISVSDNGPGIPAEAIPRIFTPFVSTKALDRPRGLGLAMVKSLVEANNGAVTVQSSPGMGTTFTIVLPAATANTLPLGTHTMEHMHHSYQTMRSVLLADDQTDVRYTVTAALTHRGHHVIAVPDMASFVHELRSPTHHFDVVVIDRGLMNLAPKELLNVASSLTKKIPCVVTSGDPTGTERSPIGGRTQIFLAKPFSLDALYRSIEGDLT